MDAESSFMLDRRVPFLVLSVGDSIELRLLAINLWLASVVASSFPRCFSSDKTGEGVETP